MYNFFHNILSDKTGGEIFTLFSLWHFFYIFLTAGTVILVLYFSKLKSSPEKIKAIQIFINIAFGLYMADFFLMPLAYGRIDIDKLPFHACTSMCIMCFASNHNKFLAKYHTSFAMLGFISNLIYLLYPAGVMWYNVHPLSYRVIQTLLFHSVMTVYCLLTLIYEREKIAFKKIHRDLTVIVCLTLWAIIGSYVYSGETEGYSNFFNWFFVVRDPFYMFPESISKIIMPFLNILLFFAVEVIIHLIISQSKKQSKQKARAL